MVNAIFSSNYRLPVAIGIFLLTLMGCETLEPVTKKGLVATLQGHTDGVPSVAFAPDGATLASGSLDTTVRLWDVATGDELAVLQGHSFRVKAVPFSPDGKLLASGDGFVWTPTPPLHFSGFGEQGKMYTPKGKLSTPFTVILWDVATGKEKTRWEVETPMHTVAFSPDGRTLAAGGGWPDSNPDDAVWIWDVTTGELKAKWRLDIVWSLAFSPDGTTLVTGQMGGFALSDVATGALRYGISTEWRVRSVAFSPDGRLIAAGGANGVVLLWDPAMSRKQVTLGRHKGVVDTLAFNSDGTILASAGEDGTVRLWDVATGEVVGRIRIPQHWASVAFSPDGTLLATGSSDNMIRLWNVAELLGR